MQAYIKRILRAACFSLCVSCAAIAILSAANASGKVPSAFFNVSGVALPYAAIALFCASFTRKVGKNGWLCGGIAAVVCALFMLGCGRTFFSAVDRGVDMLRIFACAFATGCIGGIVGINLG